MRKKRSQQINLAEESYAERSYILASADKNYLKAFYWKWRYKKYKKRNERNLWRSDKYVKIDLDKDIEYAGETENEQKLNKLLLETTLDLNYYQDSYDQMRTVDELKERIKALQAQLEAPESNFNFISQRESKVEIKVLEWVLNGSKTVEEKESVLPKARPEEVQRILDNMKKRGF